MSAGVFCRCTSWQGSYGSFEAARRASWRVVQRKCNHSKFNGRRYTPSAYSEIRCLRCGGVWRTKAAYVDTLPDATRDELQLRPRDELVCRHCKACFLAHESDALRPAVFCSSDCEDGRTWDPHA